MATIAKWRKKKWFVTEKQILDFKNLAYTYEQNAQNNSSTEGKGLTNEKGLKLFEMSFNTTLLISAGVSVRKEIESWKEEVSKVGVFYLNGKPIIKTKLRLNKVSVSETVIDNKGRMVSATIQFNFIEYEPQKPDVDTSTSAKGVKASSSDKKELGSGSSAKNATTTGVKKGTYIYPTVSVDLDGNKLDTSYPMEVVQNSNGFITFLDREGQRRTVTANQVTFAPT